jgi:hypothetical protein
MAADGLREEACGYLLVALRCEEGIESLAALSHHAIEGAPLSLHLEVRLVYLPAAPTGRLRRRSAACSGGLYFRTQRLIVA